jgi:hypothetical protein
VPRNVPKPSGDLAVVGAARMIREPAALPGLASMFVAKFPESM